MRESLQDSVVRLLRYRRAPDNATALFCDWKHNADILPRLQSQLEMLLEAYGKFEPIVYDTQGVRDDGTDIVLRARSAEADAQPELICFQIKSFDDLEKKHYMQELKAQRDDSFRKVRGLRYYFLLLCTDSKKHRDRVRNIAAEFRSADRTEVVEPPFAYSFLHHPKTRIEALVKRTMEDQDIVFRLALDLLELPSPTARGLAVFMSVKSSLTGISFFRSDQLLGDPILRDMYDDVRIRQEVLIDSVPIGEEYDEIVVADFETQLADDLSILETDVADLCSQSGGVLLRKDRVHPLSALITDALVRYEHSEAQLMTYMFSLMGVLE